MVVESGSSASFSGNTSMDRNCADGQIIGETGCGGALCVDNATASFDGVTNFNSNRGLSGGGLMAFSARVSWAGTTTYFNNSAGAGGGFFLGFSSTASWGGTTTLSNNRAQESGGGGAVTASTASCRGHTEFSDNVAQTAGGGALSVVLSNVSCGGSTAFSGNAALTGGALYVIFDSAMSWTGDSSFTSNSAEILGGGLFASASAVSWSGDTQFARNEAESGGAIFAMNGSSVGWTGDTEFLSNAASADGGAVGSASVGPGNADSALAVNGSASFSNNTCGANGGAVALLGGLAVEIGDVDVSFVDNTAAVAGGAVFVSGTAVGPSFSEVSFASNTAQVGGAVSVVGSGNLKEIADVVPPNPTTFDRCLFEDNRAAATGGAVESAAGQDAFVGSVFRGNAAGTGGALRLAGTASLDDCSFVENVSDDGGGAAVSNIGSLLKMEANSFSGNVFACQPGMYLDFNTVSGGCFIVARRDHYTVAFEPTQSPCLVVPPPSTACIRVLENRWCVLVHLLHLR